METVVKRLYEGMFLVDSTLAAQDRQVVIDEIQRMMTRADADVVSLKTWDERRMTYDIRGKSRGTYILVYFNCDPEKVKGIERDVQLSELLMRVMILRTDKMKQSDIEKATPAENAPVEAPAETVPAEAAPVETVPTEVESVDTDAPSTDTVDKDTIGDGVADTAKEDVVEKAKAVDAGADDSREEKAQ